MNVSTYEMFKAVSNAEKEEQKIELMQRFAKENQAFAILVDLIFNPEWQWLLPEGTPPYHPSPKEADLQNVLKSEARKLRYFVNTAEAKALKPLRREMMFIELIETVDFNDSLLLLSAKEKRLPFPNITIKTVKKAFPQIKGA